MNHPKEFTKTTPNHIVKWVLKERQQITLVRFTWITLVRFTCMPWHNALAQWDLLYALLVIVGFWHQLVCSVDKMGSFYMNAKTLFVTLCHNFNSFLHDKVAVHYMHF